MRDHRRSVALAATTLLLVASAGLSGPTQGGQAAPKRDEMRVILAVGHQNRAMWWKADDDGKARLDQDLRRLLGRARPGLQEIPAGRGDQVRFARVVLNSTGAGFDAVRFHTPATGESFSLRFEIVVPGNDATKNIQGWDIVGVDGPAPVVDNYSRRDNFDLPSSGFPDENFCITPYIRGPSLRPEAEYILWFDLRTDAVTPAFVKVGLTADEPAPPPRTAAVQKARAAYQGALRSIQQRYDSALSGLGKGYLTELDRAAKAAAQKKEVAESDRIVAESDEILRGESAAAGRRGFRVVQALYGIDDRWADVTDKVAPLVRGNVLRFGLGTDLDLKVDPAYGVLKRLIIAYSLDGNAGVSITGDKQRVELPPTAAILDRIPAIGSSRP